VHRYPLDLCLEAAREHRPIGFLAAQIDTGHEGRHARAGCEVSGGVEQRGEPLRAARPGSDRTEFHKAGSLSGLGRGAKVAGRETAEAAVAIPQQYRVAKAAGADRADLAAEIEARVELFVQLARRGLGRAALIFGQRGIAR